MTRYLKLWIAAFSLAVAFAGCTNEEDLGARPDAGTSTPQSDAGTSDAKAADASAKPKRVFVTSSRYYGDLMTAGDGENGIDGADKLCAVAVQAASLGGTWKAWVSRGSPSGSVETLNAIDRITDVGPWFLLDGTTKIFANKSAMKTSPLAAIDLDEKGQRITEELDVWTGTQTGGTWSGGDCEQWSSGFNNKDATRGLANRTTQQWTDADRVACGERHRLYCIEQ